MWPIQEKKQKWNTAVKFHKSNTLEFNYIQANKEKKKNWLEFQGNHILMSLHNLHKMQIKGQKHGEGSSTS